MPDKQKMGIATKAGMIRICSRRRAPARCGTPMLVGADVKTLSAALGHFNAGFTPNTYTHATPQMKRDAAVKIGELVDGRM